MFTQDENIQYWTDRARLREGWERTSNDPILRQLELQLINRILVQHSTPETIITDLGCGDGYIESHVRGIPFKEWHAVDPAAELIAIAPLVNRVSYHVGDVMLLPLLPRPDIFFTVRTLINIPDQKWVYGKISEICSPATKIFLCEASMQGLKKINEARQFFGLLPIEPPEFNKYIDEQELNQYFDILTIEHFASAYYFGSRVVNALINQDRQNYYDPVNTFFKDIKPFGEWGVHRLYYCRKRR